MKMTMRITKMKKDEKRERAKIILEALDRYYPDVSCTLDFSDPFELMVGAILATQSTDARVNMILPDLLSRYPDASAFASATAEEIEPLIQSVGLFRAKAKNLVAASKLIMDHYGGSMPREMAELLTLPGVGRKIANLIRGDAFGIPGIVVDTHCGRVSRRLGFSKSENPAVVEKDLEQVLPEQVWIKYGHYMVALGREFCKARNPLCRTCPLGEFCPGYLKFETKP
jgi:endonuclease-3